MISMNTSQFFEDPSYLDYMASKRFNGNQVVKPSKPHTYKNRDSNFSFGKQQGLPRYMMNSTIETNMVQYKASTISKKKNSIDYKYSIYDTRPASSYSSLKPRLATQRHSIADGKYKSPYGQVRKTKKKKKKVETVVYKESTVKQAAELFHSIV